MMWLIVLAVLITGSCQIPDPGITGRDADPGDEVLVIHSLAETMTSIALHSDGSPGSVDHDVQYLGAAPNDIIRLRERYLVTVSGENALLLLDAATTDTLGRIDLGAGTNPMAAAVVGEEIIAVTEFLSHAVSLQRTATSVPPQNAEVGRFAVGAAPQAIMTLPGTESDVTRIIVANTAFTLNSPSGFPFGAASLSVRSVRIDASGSAVRLVSEQEIPLEADGFDAAIENGLNPTALLDMPPTGELLVVGSGENYGGSGTGDDDGVLLVLDRMSLEIRRRISVGGSPGAGVVVERTGGYDLYLAGVEGMRRVHRGTVWDEESSFVYRATGDPLPFISDIVAAGDFLYASDFSGSRILVFRLAATGGVTLECEIPVSHGPIALLADRS